MNYGYFKGIVIVLLPKAFDPWIKIDKNPYLQSLGHREIGYQEMQKDMMADTMFNHLLFQTLTETDRSQQNLIHSNNILCMLPNLMGESYTFWIFIMKFKDTE